MKTQFEIFGLERIDSPNPIDEKSGQPYLFRKYPEHFESFSKAREELEKIIKGKSPFVHFKFRRYSIIETFV